MFGDLTALGYGIITFAILVGVGSVILFNFGNATGGTANTNVQYLLTQMGQSGLAKRHLATCKEIYTIKPEFRLKPRNRQDRSVKHSYYALTTDKGYSASYDDSIRYSLNTIYN